MFAVNLSAQASLSGTVTTESGTAEFMNVALLQAADSAVIKLNLTDEDGRFTFSDLAPGDYRLRVMGIGYADYDTDLFTLTEGQQLELPTLNLRTTGTDLQTVEVTARKPFLEQRAGRLVVNVDQSLTGQGGSVTDLLKKVPGLIVVGNRVSMAGPAGPDHPDRRAAYQVHGHPEPAA